MGEAPGVQGLDRLPELAGQLAQVLLRQVQRLLPSLDVGQQEVTARGRFEGALGGCAGLRGNERKMTP